MSGTLRPWIGETIKTLHDILPWWQQRLICFHGGPKFWCWFNKSTRPATLKTPSVVSPIIQPWRHWTRYDSQLVHQSLWMFLLEIGSMQSSKIVRRTFLYWSFYFDFVRRLGWWFFVISHSNRPWCQAGTKDVSPGFESFRCQCNSDDPTLFMTIVPKYVSVKP